MIRYGARRQLAYLLVNLFAAAAFAGAPAGAVCVPPAFSIGPAMPAGAYVGELFRADFNGDGLLDLAAHGAMSGSATLFLIFGTGGGTFGPPVAVTVPATWVRPVAGDFDGDGDVDLAATAGEFASTEIVVLANDGVGGFGQQITTPLPYRRIIRAADFNGDGRSDLLIGCSHEIHCAPDVAKVMLGSAAGTFSDAPAGTFPLSDAAAPLIADFDGDADLDLLAAQSDNSVALHRGDGTGGFAAPETVLPTLPNGGTHYPLANADFDGDGDLDLLLLSSTGAAEVAPGLGDGTGAFAAGFFTYTDRHQGVVEAEIVDIDGDARADAVIQSASSNNLQTISVLPSAGKSAFCAPANFDLGWNTIHPTSFVTGDFTGDGRPDIVVAADDEFHLLTNEGQGGSDLSFSFQVDRFELSGQRNHVEDFDTGLGDWGPYGTVTHGGGLVTLSSPGAIDNTFRIKNGIILSRSDVFLSTPGTSLDLVDGQGDFASTSKWVPIVPEPPSQFYGMWLLVRADPPSLSGSCMGMNEGLSCSTNGDCLLPAFGAAFPPGDESYGLGGCWFQYSSGIAGGPRCFASETCHLEEQDGSTVAGKCYGGCQTTARMFAVFFSNFDAMVASHFGVPAGPVLGFYEAQSYCTGDCSGLLPGAALPGGAIVSVQAAPVNPADVTGDILFRLAVNDATDAISATVSLDGGATFIQPFANSGELVPSWQVQYFGLLGDPPPPDHLQLNKNEAICAVGMQSKGAALAKRHGKEKLKCLLLAAAGKLGGSAQACAADGSKTSIAKSAAALQGYDAKKCAPLSTANPCTPVAPATECTVPAYGYRPASVIASSHADESLALVADLFGPDLDAVLATTATEKAGAACQKSALLTAQKVFDSLWKIARKRSKAGFTGRGGPVMASRDELGNGLASALGIYQPLNSINKVVDKFATGPCSQTGLERPLAALLPGKCGGASNGSELASCVRYAARCRFCRSFNATNGTEIDCDNFDDFDTGGSCP